MRRAALVIVAAVAITTVLVVHATSGADQAPERQRTAREVRSATQLSCFTGGGGTAYGYQKVCVSTHGNLTRFESPAGHEHLTAGTLYEGYTMCTGTTVRGYDLASAEEGFGSATVSQPNGAGKFPLTITRNTATGNLRLIQKFSHDVQEQEFAIRMIVKNRGTSQASDVTLMRHFDGDVNGTPVNDDWIKSNESASAVQNAATAFGLSTGSAKFIHFASVHTFGDFSSLIGTCLFGATVSTPVEGDHAGTVGYALGNIGAGKKKAVTFVYRAA